MSDFKPAHERVTDPSYFMNAMLNMSNKKPSGIKSRDDSRIRFGSLGEGTNPNYEVTSEDETIRANYDGKYHNLHHRQEAFKSENLSEQFTYDDVERLLVNVLSTKL